MSHLAQVRAPVLIVHSRDDEIIPFHHGQQLYAAAPTPKQFIEASGGHNDGLRARGEQYLSGIEMFLRATR